MVTKTHKADLGLGLPEKKKTKKKKKVVVLKEPETQYSLLNNDHYFADVSPSRDTSPSDDGGQAQPPEMPVGKKKKKKKGHGTPCEELLEPEPTTRAKRTKSPSPRKQAVGHSESPSGEKKKKRKSLAPHHSASVKISPDPRESEEAARAGKKPKKHKKEKKAPDAAASSPEASWLCEAGDALYTCTAGTEAGEQAALGQKRKQGSPRTNSVKMKKKKTHQEGEAPPGLSRCSRSLESSPRRGRKNRAATDEVVEEDTPIGDGPRAPGKKTKPRKAAEQPVVEEVARKRKKKKKRKESEAAEDTWAEESDTDLEVVLEKKGNMDEACIDQVRRKALQEEIDRESGKTEASEPKKWTGTQFGQWDTAGFENEEQKLKFLKLMGGFKHLSPSFSRPPSTAGRPNMALSKKAADALQQNLQQDYDRAMSWKYSRGAGLGFAARDKVFYIDRNASRSVRLDD